MIEEDLKAMRESMDEMRQDADKLLEQVREMKTNFTWGCWEPYCVGIVPKRINGRWYWRGDVVYRRQRIGVGGVHYKYGDDFDRLKETNDLY